MRFSQSVVRGGKAKLKSVISVFMWSFLLVLVGMGHMLFWHPPEVRFPRCMVLFGHCY